MDTKLKKRYKVLNTLMMLFILAAVLLCGVAASEFNKRAAEVIRYEKEKIAANGYEYVEDEIPSFLIEGSYALYAEEMNSWEEDLIKDDNNHDFAKQTIQEYKSDFAEIRKSVDYAIIGKTQVETPIQFEPVYQSVLETSFNMISTNATDDLLYFVPEYTKDMVNTENADHLKEKYVLLVAIEYDANGNISIPNSYNRDGLAAEYVRDIMAYQKYVQYGDEGIGFGAPRNVIFVYAISENNPVYPLYQDQKQIDYYPIYRNSTGFFPTMWIVLGVLGFIALIFGRPWSKKDGREGAVYLEVALISVVAILGIIPEETFELYYAYAMGEMDVKTFCGLYAIILTPSFLLWCWSIVSLRMFIGRGWNEYKQHCFIYEKREKIRAFRENLKYEIDHLDLEDSKAKTIKKVVIINFVILSIISLCWFVGPFILIIYCAVVSFMLKKHASKTAKQLRMVKDAAADIASGDFKTDKLDEDMGIYNDVRDELKNIADGFSQAVIEETKSSRMKTELVTNVSHDLKTPLTAITTYVELLKDPSLDEEKRKEYIEVLERKSMRLKVLIEDLFELSKASSDTMSLEMNELNVCHLIKQVATEQDDKLKAKNLNLIYDMPEEIMLTLDGAKAYRIFENLFVNAAKYALAGTRVYVDAMENVEEGQVVISMVNVSEGELNFNEQEITERFVRGDVSRNTEGSGLGLAIVKSFTEAMGGTFEIKTDKDLFKAIVTWKK